jgi:hypothetical protein
MGYTGYSAVENLYSFYEEFGSRESYLKSYTAYQYLTQTLSNTPLKLIYDFRSTSNAYEIKINKMIVDIEKEAAKVRLEKEGEFGQKLYNYIYSPIIEQKFDLLNKIRLGVVTKDEAKALELKQIKLTSEYQNYDHCLEIGLDDAEERSNHYYCYSETKQILDHIVVTGTANIEMVEHLYG